MSYTFIKKNPNQKKVTFKKDPVEKHETKKKLVIDDKKKESNMTLTGQKKTKSREYTVTIDDIPNTPIPDDAIYEHPLTKCGKNFLHRLSRQFVPRKTIIFCSTFLWTIVLWSVLYEKVEEESNTTMKETFSYYTNITFLIQAIFYTLYLCSYLEDSKKRTLERVLLVYFLLFVFAQIYLVAILVMFVLYDSPGLVMSNMKSFGGEYDDGMVLLADRMFHVVPAFLISVFLFAVWPDYVDLSTSCLSYVKYPLKKTIATQVDFVAGLSTNGETYTSPTFAFIHVIRKNFEKLKKMSQLDLFDYIVDREYVVNTIFEEEKLSIQSYSKKPQQNITIPFEQKTVEYYSLFVPFWVKLEYLFFQCFIACAPFLIYMAVVDIHEKYGVEERFTTWVLIMSILVIGMILVIGPIYFLFASSLYSYSISTNLAKLLFNETCSDIVKNKKNISSLLKIVSTDIQIGSKDKNKDVFEELLEIGIKPNIPEPN